jgi:hypothetical protein
MRIFVLLFLAFPLFADSFITLEEYARQLYKNPRGIGCHHCHGEEGKGLTVARYIHRKEKRTFAGPPIDGVPLAAFSEALDSRVRGMPRYFLTPKEIKALYYYLHPELLEEKGKKEVVKTGTGERHAAAKEHAGNKGFSPASMFP